MQILHPVCCGVDVHKKVVVACLRVQEPGGRVRRERRRFGTTTDALLALVDWLRGAGCTLVVAESTGVYWKPIHNLLEGLDGLAIWVVNAAHAKAASADDADRQHGLPGGERRGHGPEPSSLRTAAPAA